MSLKLPIFSLEFPTQHLVASTFLRFQEHYESPRFSGKFFSLETYMDWYAATRGSFSYLTDWGRFNIPSWVLAPFRAGDFGRLSMKERALLKTLPATHSPFYVIATYTAAQGSIMAHEIVHGHYHLFPKYAEQVQGVIAHDADKYSVRVMREHLTAMGYGAHVQDDEMNAYLLTGLPELPPRLIRSLESLRIKLHATFRFHFGYALDGKGGEARLMRSVTRIPYSRFARELRGQKEVWET